MACIGKAKPVSFCWHISGSRNWRNPTRHMASSPLAELALYCRPPQISIVTFFRISSWQYKSHHPTKELLQLNNVPAVPRDMGLLNSFERLGLTQNQPAETSSLLPSTEDQMLRDVLGIRNAPGKAAVRTLLKGGSQSTSVKTHLPSLLLDCRTHLLGA